MARRSTLRITVSGVAGRSFLAPLKRLLKEAAGFCDSPLRDLTVILVGDRRMAELHRRFMNDPSVTDVLTFPIDLDARGRPLSGEVYVCVPLARRMARQHGISPLHELLLYALHGLLHLSGFDDRTARGFRLMHRREDYILSRLGIGPVFAASTGKRRARHGANAS
jgi:rRNA maturation RNase YbeY